MTQIIKNNKFIVSVLTTILIAIGIGVVTFLKTPNNYVAIDVNPSIEIETNRLNKVVKINAANEDAQKLLEGMNLTNRDIEDVVIDIIDKLVEAGYIKEGAENEILLTVANSSTSTELLDKVNKTIATILEGKKLEAKLIDQTIDLNDEILNAAHEHNVSAGKYNIIEKISKDDNKVTLEELATIKISDLFEYAKLNKIDFEDVLEEYEDAFEDAMEDQQDAIEDKLDDDDDDDDDKDTNKDVIQNNNPSNNQNNDNSAKAKDDDDDDDDDKDTNKDAIQNSNSSNGQGGSQPNQNTDSGKENTDKSKYDNNTQSNNNDDDDDNQDDDN